jgi:methionine-rich copper-binding protein CopC
MIIPNRSFIRWGVIIGALLLMWAGTQQVLAHAVLVNADPVPNSIVNTPPKEVWILFSEPIEPAFSQIQVFSQSGQRVDNGDLTVANSDNTALSVSLPLLAEGTYLVNWRVLSTVDGHATGGTFPFGYGVGEISAEAGAVSTSGHTDTHPDGDLFYWIKEGIDGSAMPAFDRQLSDDEIWNLVNYVRRLSSS